MTFPAGHSFMLACKLKVRAIMIKAIHFDLSPIVGSMTNNTFYFKTITVRRLRKEGCNKDNI